MHAPAMKLSWKFAIITVAVGIPAFFIGPFLWPPSSDLPTPSQAQLGFFALLSFIEALFFGVGVAFAALGAPLIHRVPAESKKRTAAAFVSLVWLLVSWWPHDSLHIHVGEDVQKILYIDYGFHLTVIIAALIIAGYFFTSLRREAE